MLRFDEGVTAIVGPNGSGKSNVMDALRWVIGESAGRQMRIKRQDDVIFSGSAARAPAGLAEVRLLLDNRDGWLPLDLAEVSVARRVHRDGESEFLINDRGVRLREIQELFLHSGLGSGSYALMGQGLVEQVLRLKPEERRGLIEDVADVRRHRRKMEDSRRRRREAHENLERARLLIEEIEPRMKTLERQARRARQYAQIGAELRQALQRYYRAEWRRLAQRLADREREAADRETRRASARETLDGGEAALAEWEAQVAAAREALERSSAERLALAERLRELEHAQALETQRAEMLRGRLAELRAELDPSADEADARMAPQPNLTPSGEASGDAGRESERAEAQIEAAAAELAAAEQRREAAAAALQALDGEIEDLRRARRELEAELARSCDRLTMLRELQAESEGLRQGLRALFGAHGAPRDGHGSGIPGVVGVLRHRIKPRSGSERAIEAALDAYLDGVIFETADDALQTLHALAADRAGRIVALPLDAWQPRRPLAMQAERGVIGVASALVRCDDAVRPLVDTLLGRVVVVEDLETAQRLRARGVGGEYVTLDGTLLHPSGALSGGQLGEAGAFERENELATLPETIEGVERGLREAGDPARLEARREQLRLEHGQRTAEAARAEARWRLAKEQGERLHAELERRRARREQLHAQQRELTALDASLEGRTTELRAATRELEAADASAPEAERLQALLGRQQGLRAAAKRAHDDLLEAERALVAAEAVRNEAGAERERLAEQARADQIPLEAPAEAPLDPSTIPQPAASRDEPPAFLRGYGGGSPANGGSPPNGGGQLGVVPAAASGAAPSATSAPLESPAQQPEKTPLEDVALDDAALDELREHVDALRSRLRWLGNVNPDAAAEYDEIAARHALLSEQIDDLEGAEQRMLAAEAELGQLIRERFEESFNAVDRGFQRYFRTMFRGGQARLELTEEDDPEATGVEIVAQPPGKRLADLALLSGGERSLTAIALLFAMLEVNPAPFCVLDEVDAALDEANVGRFVDALKQLAAGSTQFVVITHNRRTIEQADGIYGVTMGADSVSHVLSVRISDLELED